MDIYGERINAARDLMRRQSFDYLLIGPSANMYYFSGLNTSPDERLQLLIIPASAEKHPAALLPEMYLQKAKEVIASTYSLHAWPDNADPFAMAGDLIGNNGRMRILIDDTMRSDHLIGLGKALGEAEFEPASLVVSSLRAYKDNSEVELMREAGRAADRVMEKVREEIKPGMSESELSLLIEIEYRQQADDISFKPIVASGPHAAQPHHSTGSRRFEVGDLIVVDCGALYRGYCSDITRTFCLGKADPEMKKVYSVVQEANAAAFRALEERGSLSGEELDAAARLVITEAGYGQYFIHRTGHGIGLEVHEEPYIVEGNREPLRQGNAFTIEPGIYLPGRFGVRIEDVAVITGAGPERLTSYERGLIEL